MPGDGGSVDTARRSPRELTRGRNADPHEERKEQSCRTMARSPRATAGAITATGYGSSLKDGNDRCARCNGTGLVAADRSGGAAAAPTNGSGKTDGTSG